MKCYYCNVELSDNALVCPNCGCPINLNKQFSSENNTKGIECHRSVYVWSALLFGWLGIHDFYAGYYLKGVLKILLTITIIGFCFSVIWAIIDACIVKKNRQGELFI